MIVLNLSCDNQHRFEGWFANADAFADQSARGLVECPSCGSKHIERRPSAPYINTSVSRGNAAAPAAPQAVKADAGAPTIDPAKLAAALRMAAKGAEDVGERFPEEARRIHYGEAETRSIRGQASGDDLGELLEEGILVLPVPDEPSVQ